MSKLVPTPIINKNGVATTVYKRPAVSRSAMPAPPALDTWKIGDATSLPIEESLTSSQNTKTYRSVYIGDHKYSAALRKHLKQWDDFLTGHYSDLEMYEALSMTTPGDALLLLNAGMTSRSTIIEYLHKHNFSKLIKDSSDTVAQALDNRIPPLGYLKNQDIIAKGGPYVMDALKVASDFKLGQNTDLVEAVRTGQIKIKLLTGLGFERLSKVSSEVLLDALMAATNEDSPFTRKGLSAALLNTRYGTSHVSDLIRLGLKYGDKMTNLPNPDRALYLDAKLIETYPEMSDDYRSDIVIFVNTLRFRHTIKNMTSPLKLEEEIMLHDAGATVDQYMAGEFSLERARDIMSSPARGLSEGVL